MSLISEEVSQTSEEVFDIWKKCLIQFTAIDRHILHNLQEISKAKQLTGILDLKNPYRPVKMDKSKEKELNQNLDYIYYRKNLFIQDMLGYAMLCPQVLTHLKKMANDKEVLRNEIEKRSGDGLLQPEIDDTIGVFITCLGSIENSEYEDGLENAEVNEDSIISYLKASKINKIDDDIQLKNVGLKLAYDELNQDINDQGVDIRSLETIEKFWRNIFTSTKFQIDVIKFLTDDMSTMGSHFEGIKPKPEEQQDYDMVIKDIIQYVNNISEKPLKEFQGITNTNGSDVRKLLNVFRSIRSAQDNKIHHNHLDFLHMVFWLVTKGMSIPEAYEFYERNFNHYLADKDKKKRKLNPADAASKKKIQDLLSNQILKEKNGQLHTDNNLFSERIKQLQKDLEHVHILAKTPGKLKEAKQSLKDNWRFHI